MGKRRTIALAVYDGVALLPGLVEAVPPFHLRGRAARSIRRDTAAWNLLVFF